MGGEADVGAGGGVAGEDGGGNDIFHRLLDDTAHRAGAHLRVVTLF